MTDKIFMSIDDSLSTFSSSDIIHFFEMVCTEEDLGGYCSSSGPPFDASDLDIIKAIKKINHLYFQENHESMNFSRALKLLAYSWEVSCLTNGEIEGI